MSHPVVDLDAVEYAGSIIETNYIWYADDERAATPSPAVRERRVEVARIVAGTAVHAYLSKAGEKVTVDRQVEAMGKLRVSLGEHWRLVIDASALVGRVGDMERWVLLDERNGAWLHPASGQRGALSEILRAIACCYLDDAPGLVDGRRLVEARRA